MTAQERRSGCEWLHCWSTSDKHHVDCGLLSAKLDELQEQTSGLIGIGGKGGAFFHAHFIDKAVCLDCDVAIRERIAERDALRAKAEEQAREIDKLHEISLETMRERDSIRSRLADADRLAEAAFMATEAYWWDSADSEVDTLIAVLAAFKKSREEPKP